MRCGVGALEGATRRRPSRKSQLLEKKTIDFSDSTFGLRLT